MPWSWRPVIWNPAVNPTLVPALPVELPGFEGEGTRLTGIADAAQIRKAAGECLKRVPLEKRIRLLGVRAGALIARVEAAAEQAVAQAVLPF